METLSWDSADLHSFSCRVELWSVMFVHSGFCSEGLFFFIILVFLVKLNCSFGRRGAKGFFLLFLCRFFFFFFPAWEQPECEPHRILWHLYKVRNACSRKPHQRSFISYWQKRHFHVICCKVSLHFYELDFLLNLCWKLEATLLSKAARFPKSFQMKSSHTIETAVK